jgi:hypothetical protein
MNRRAALTVGVALLLIASGAALDRGEAADRLVRVGQPAPEITGGPWINSDPISLAGLRGRVVLVEFWTYG